MNFEGRNVFVTGGAGFIGSTLTRKLVEINANVTIFDNFISGSLENLKEINDNIKIVEGDIRDKNFEDILKENEAEFVFNLAALPFIPACYDNPNEFFEINANGALNVLMACKKAKVERVIQYSS